jgi:hypothetical protein
MVFGGDFAGFIVVWLLYRRWVIYSFPFMFKGHGWDYLCYAGASYLIILGSYKVVDLYLLLFGTSGVFLDSSPWNEAKSKIEKIRRRNDGLDRLNNKISNLESKILRLESRVFHGEVILE